MPPFPSTSFVPTQAELALVNQILALADTQKLNLVTGDAAVKVFAGAKLSPVVLGEIWALADAENNGFLTRTGLATSVRLIGHAQQGETVTVELLDRPSTKLAHIEGVSKPTPQTPSDPSSPSPRSPPPRGAHLPPLTPEDKSKFTRIFVSCGPVDGLLSGEKSRDVFVKSRLSVDQLGQIWALADTQDRGALDQTDFTIAMYLIQAVMSGQLPVVPNSLPPHLYEQAGGRPSRGIVVHNTGTSQSLTPSLTGTFGSNFGIQSQFTGSTPVTAHGTGSVHPLHPQSTGQMRQPHVQFASPNTGSILGASAFGNTATAVWDVTPAEKARFDQFFDGLDKQKNGFIEGDIAVPFMLQSKLSQEVLAPIWDMADLNNDGRLTRDGFAIAMHLIQSKLAGKEVPTTMPESLLPPTMRTTSRIAMGPPAPAPEPVRDLLWDDSPPASPALAPQPTTRSPPAAPATQPAIFQPQRTGTGSLSPQPTGGFGSRSTVNDPFNAAFAPPKSASSRDLLSDDDEADVPSAPVPDNSVEIGNVQNQLQSTNRSLESTKAERQQTEQSIANQAAQLSSLQTQLASAKAAYETEVRLVSTLRERFVSQSSDMQKVREELISAESDLSAIRVEKTEIEGTLMRDKEDHRELQRKMKAAGEEAEQLKSAVEKLKKDTKHQKGLLAIAKKQLASREAERAKAVKDLEEAERETNDSGAELDSIEAELAKKTEPLSRAGNSAIADSTTHRMDTPSFAAAMPLPSSPSPQGSISSPVSTKRNNPFERLAMASDTSTPRAQSPLSHLEGGQASKGEGVGSPFESPSPFVGSSDEILRASSPFMHNSDVKASPPSEVPRPASPFMHVAEASATSGTSLESAEDPFGLGDGEGKQQSDSTVSTTPENRTSPPPRESVSDSVLSPDNSFQTASTSPDTDILSPALNTTNDAKGHANDPITAVAKEHFPAVDQGMDDGFVDTTYDGPEMPSRVLEIEANESDSDNEAEFEDAKTQLPGAAEQEMPAMAEVTDSTPKQPHISTLGEESSGDKATQQSLAKNFDGTFGTGNDETRLAPGASGQLFDDAFEIGKPEKGEHKDLYANGFDDAFAVKTEEAKSHNAIQSSSADLLNNFFSSMSTPSSDKPDMTRVAAQPSGVSSFDEAMSNLTPGPAGSQPQFKLDSFEDSFDFGATSNVEVASSPPALSQPANGFPAGSSNIFDSAFLPPNQQYIAQAPTGAQVSPKQPVSLNTSEPSATGLNFDDAFATVSSRVSVVPSAAIPFDGFDVEGPSLADTLGKTTTDRNGDVKKSSESGIVTPSRISISPPPESPGSRVPGSKPSGRLSSPPRATSPRPRPSTGSSGDSGLVPNKQPAAARHSKLSIRLPFGRKDKKKKNEPPPPSHLSQGSSFLSPVSEPDRGSSPAVEDDVEPVKQLCSMGFSRSQAVSALESNGYSFQKALESLLRAAK